MTTSAAPRRIWRHPIVLIGLTEAGYLLYFHVVASAPHSAWLFRWLPFGSWVARGPVEVALFYTGCVGALFLLYGVLLRDLWRRPGLPRQAAAVFGGALLFALTLLLQPVLLSKDLFDYMGHGHLMTVYGANPYTTPADAFPQDQFTQVMGWRAATPLYGPVWASLCGLLALVGRSHLLATAVLFKLFFILIHLLNGLLIFWIARRWETPDAGSGSPRAVFAAAFYLWNPLVLTQTAGDGHNDGVALTWLLLGIWLLQRRDVVTGAATAAMSVLVKYVTAPVVLLMATSIYRQEGKQKTAVFLAICAVVAGVAYAPYFSGFQPAHFLRPYEHSSYQGSLMMMVELVVGQVIPGANEPGSPLASVLLVISIVAAACFALWFIRAWVRTQTLRDSVENGGWALLLYLLFVTALLRTSYLVWIVGLAALAACATLRRTVALFSLTVLALEVLWVWRILLPAPPPGINAQRFAASAVALGVPILYLLLQFRAKLIGLLPGLKRFRDRTAA